MWGFLLLGVGYGCREEEPVDCGFAETCEGDDCEDDEPEDEEEEGTPPVDPFWVDCSLSAAERTDVLRVVHSTVAAVEEIGRGARLRDELVWSSIGGLRRSLFATPVPGPEGGTTGGDTASGSGSTSSSGSGSTSSSGSGSTSSSGSASATGDDAPAGGPRTTPTPAMRFEDGVYRFYDGSVAVVSEMVVAGPLPFAPEGTVLERDLRQVETYFSDYGFVPEGPPAFLDILPEAGEMEFSSLEPYFPLLGLDPELTSPAHVERDQLLDLSRVGVAPEFAHLDDIEVNTDLTLTTGREGTVIGATIRSRTSSLRELFAGSTATWELTTFDVEDSRTRHTGTLVEGQFWHRTKDHDEVVYGEDPDFAGALFHGEIELAVVADSYAYEVAYSRAVDAVIPRVVVTCR